jgi:hypothetical protein
MVLYYGLSRTSFPRAGGLVAMQITILIMQVPVKSRCLAVCAVSLTHTNFFANHQHYAPLISPLKERLKYTTYRHPHHRSLSISD